MFNVLATLCIFYMAIGFLTGASYLCSKSIHEGKDFKSELVKYHNVLLLGTITLLWLPSIIVAALDGSHCVKKGE